MSHRLGEVLPKLHVTMERVILGDLKLPYAPREEEKHSL